MLPSRFRRSSGSLHAHLLAHAEVPKKLAAIEARYKDATIERMDGLSVDCPNWHLHVRPSNTEPPPAGLSLN